jgi:hypothetical protein
VTGRKLRVDVLMMVAYPISCRRTLDRTRQRREDPLPPRNTASLCRPSAPEGVIPFRQQDACDTPWRGYQPERGCQVEVRFHAVAFGYIQDGGFGPGTGIHPARRMARPARTCYALSRSVGTIKPGRRWRTDPGGRLARAECRAAAERCVAVCVSGPALFVGRTRIGAHLELARWRRSPGAM